MNATEIIAKLIDEKKINGEEAIILLDAIKSTKIEYVPYHTPWNWDYPITCYKEIY